MANKTEDKHKVTVEEAKKRLKKCKKNMKAPDDHGTNKEQYLSPSNDWKWIKSVPKVRFS
jgi:ribosomal protein L24